ncbi:YbaB/EbfC family nucleoid-associated protein [Micromonospora sp. NBC_00858]|uniref:YbaB/EbfC family nucleoid-associated protein n=1 Tax=Micromonospora sp. NBC_00858 TaxID=2975979 RepID=UPI00386FC930|nr:YbaB/EbfC family nucleoid-associated protein [Micromonospora sp. NBC_00858]
MQSAVPAQPDFQEFLQNAQAFQDRMRNAQTELERAIVTGRSDDGTVTVLVSGLGKLQAVQVDPQVFDERDVQRLQNAIAEAVRSAGATASRLAAQKMGPVEINLY